MTMNFYPALYTTKFQGINIASTLTWRTHKEQLTSVLSTPCYVIRSINPHMSHVMLILLLGNELPLMVESFGFLNDLFPFPSILDAGYLVVFNLHLANILFDVILPSVLVSSL